MSYKMKLQKGESLVTKEPIMEIVLGGRRRTYLWIGDDAATGGSGCFATKSGPDQLERFARAILRELGKK